MDFKKLGQLGGLLGAVIFAYGLIVLAANQSRTFKSSIPQTGNFMQDMSRGLDRAGEQLEYMDAEQRRAIKRDDSKKVMIAGGLVLFVGIAIMASAKKTLDALPSK